MTVIDIATQIVTAGKEKGAIGYSIKMAELHGAIHKLDDKTDIVIRMDGVISAVRNGVFYDYQAETAEFANYIPGAIQTGLTLEEVDAIPEEIDIAIVFPNKETNTWDVKTYTPDDQCLYERSFESYPAARRFAAMICKELGVEMEDHCYDN